MTQTPILTVKNLVVEFCIGKSTIKAVKNISFELSRGETLGVVGESGSGKSVTALSIMNLIESPPGKIVAGEVIYEDKKEAVDFLKLNEHQLRNYRASKIAMIFQEPMTSLNPVKNCGKQITEALILHQKLTKKEAEKRTLELLKEVRLPKPERIYHSYPHQISGGQKQRVMIAMAISCSPDILIADEPTTALDVSVQKSILELLKSLQKKYGMSIIFISHDLGVISEIADRALIIYRGEIVETAGIIDLFKNPKHPYTRGLLACRPRLDINLKRLPTITDFIDSEKEYSVEEYLKTLTINTKELPKTFNHHEPVIGVKNLETHFTTKTNFWGKPKEIVRAVDGVSLEVFQSETLGLVGESGCGKTTLGRSILHLISPTGGEVFYKGASLGKLSTRQLRSFRKKMQIIFQDPYSSLNPRKMVGPAIMEPMIVHELYSNIKERKEKTMELLLKVKLDEDHFYRYPHELSGGQRQRICIARALGLKPEFIICDESVSALDVSIQAEILNLLNELKREFHLTYIFISHDLSVVKFMSDRMAVMKDGKIVELGITDRIYNNPQTEHTIKLIEAIPKSLN
ncbi:MAG: ABC transporter ATP-binding protein [Bacteroidetes bacterium]|nr:ABC transporter ATP-binding protein [Bacteroidota bacterium]